LALILRYSISGFVLKGQLDKLGPQFRSANAKFVTDCQTARMIVDAAASHISKPAPTGQLLSFCSFSMIQPSIL